MHGGGKAIILVKRKEDMMPDFSGPSFLMMKKKFLMMKSEMLTKVSITKKKNLQLMMKKKM